MKYIGTILTGNIVFAMVLNQSLILSHTLLDAKESALKLTGETY